MVKTLCTILAVVVILTGAVIFERNAVYTQFEEFETAIEILYEKTENKTANSDDALAVQSFWLEKKNFLHAFISHNEIREIDLWLSESVTYLKAQEWTEALAKIEVLKEIVEQAPKSFSFSFANVF